MLLYLMSMPEPGAAVRTAVDSAAAWLKATEISGYTFSGGRADAGGRTLRATPGAGPLWPRFVSLSTGKAIFGDRDKTIHDTVTELSPERRNGYAWYSPGPQAALDAYATWSARYGH